MENRPPASTRSGILGGRGDLCRVLHPAIVARSDGSIHGVCLVTTRRIPQGEVVWERDLGVRLSMRNSFGEGHTPVVEDGTLVTNDYDESEDHWLPALHLRYQLGRDTIARAAFTQSVVRPTFEQLSLALVNLCEGQRK